MTSHRTAPVYLNLFRIRFPVGAVTSFAHRISGVLLSVSLPFFVYLLDLSLQDEDGFAAATGWLGNDLVQLGLSPVLWSVLHHLLSGIRFLLMDVERGVQLPAARVSAWVVNVTAVVLTLLYLWRIL